VGRGSEGGVGGVGIVGVGVLGVSREQNRLLVLEEVRHRGI